MTMFDNYLMVDWSANKDPIMGENSIWLSLIEKGEFIDLEFPNPCTRYLACKVIGDILKKTEGRTLVGFDFPFGYPADSYDGFRRNNWAELWDLISKEIDDKPNNNNNRFKVAGDLNSYFDGNGPFWGQHQAHDFPNLEHGAPPEGYDGDLPSEFRHIEKLLAKLPAINPKPVWQLFGNGSVGSQTLVGIPKVNKLRKELNCAIWPFENIDDSSKHVIAEIFPSIWKITETGQTKDEKQVKTVAKNIAYLDETELLQKFLDAPFDYERNNKINEGDIIKKEGWILGVDENGNPAQCP